MGWAFGCTLTSWECFITARAKSNFGPALVEKKNEKRNCTPHRMGRFMVIAPRLHHRRGKGEGVVQKYDPQPGWTGLDWYDSSVPPWPKVGQKGFLLLGISIRRGDKGIIGIFS